MAGSGKKVIFGLAVGWKALGRFEELGGHLALKEAHERTKKRIEDDGGEREEDLLEFYTMLERTATEFEVETIRVDSEEEAEVEECGEVPSMVESEVEVQGDGTEVEVEKVRVIVRYQITEFLIKTPGKPKNRGRKVEIPSTVPDSDEGEDERNDDVMLMKGSGASTPTPTSGRKGKAQEEVLSQIFNIEMDRLRTEVEGSRPSIRTGGREVDEDENMAEGEDDIRKFLACVVCMACT
ncbi:hypothetical protein BGX38DRAFT_1333099 [Terfezia claveryi]|nr:hypothetical protein BGX38DRAFT_1333099 [Terfezia claveryi]